MTGKDIIITPPPSFHCRKRSYPAYISSAGFSVQEYALSCFCTDFAGQKNNSLHAKTLQKVCPFSRRLRTRYRGQWRRRRGGGLKYPLQKFHSNSIPYSVRHSSLSLTCIRIVNKVGLGRI